jgi:nitric oxide dioxygenase
MTPETIRLVRTSFEHVLPVSDLAASLFYDRLFTLDPSLRSLFPDDLENQKRALMATLQLAVGRLDRLDELVPVVQQLGVRHAGYGVQPAHYPTVGSALLWTLEQGLGEAFTPAVRQAWASVYDLLATTMQGAAERAPTDPRLGPGRTVST